MPEESTTWAVKLNAPAVVGVPVIAPVMGFRFSPGGNEPAVIENVYGGVPPVAVSEEEYGTPTSPVAVPHVRASGVGGVVMVMLQLAVAVLVAVLPEESVT